MSGSPWTLRLAGWMLARPWLIVVGLVTATAGAATALPRLTFDTGADRYLDKTLPDYRFNDEIKRRFVSDEVVLLVYEAPDLFTAESLSAVRRLGDALVGVRLPPDDFAPIREVDSLATLKDVVGSDMSFRSEPLVPDPVPTEASALAHVRERALKNPLIRENYLSGDLATAAVVIRLAADLRDNQASQVLEAIIKHVETADGWGGWTRSHLAGKRVILRETSKATQADTRRFLPIALATMALLLLVTFRRLTGVLLVLVNTVLCLVMGISVLPLLSFPFTQTCGMLTPLIVMLSCAAGIHYLSELSQNARHHPHLEAARLTLGDLTVPSLMCAFTTLVGFASLGLNSMPALREFALVSAIIVVLVTVVTFCTMSVAFRWAPAQFWTSPRSLAVSPLYDRFVSSYVGMVTRHPKGVLLCAGAVFAVTAAGMVRLHTDTNILEDLGRPDVPIRQVTELVEERMGGIESVVVSVRAARENQFLEPEAIGKLVELEAYLRQEEKMEHVVSLASFVKLMHQGFFSEDPKEYRVPDTREGVAQLLLLNGDRKLDQYVDGARRWVRLVARHSNHSAIEQMKMFDRVRARLQSAFPASQGYQAEVTGDSRVRVLANRHVVATQTTGLGLAFILIFGPIFIAMRSIRIGMLSIPSNLFPIGLVLGIMGWFDIPLNSHTAMIAPITLGMVVDDSIHFLQSLRDQTRGSGDVRGPLEQALRSKLAAVFVGCLVFVSGFSLLLLSQFPPVIWFGLLTGLSVFFGLVGELLVTPPLALLAWPKPRVADAAVAARTQEP
jgi:uncharacterized protein